MIYKEIKGDLISLAKKGEFDAIAHGCNCFCSMKSGIAPQIAETFGCDKYPFEDTKFKGNINKLGAIDYKEINNVAVINAYTQYFNRTLNPDKDAINLDYQALSLCLRKINHTFKGKKIGLPQIGAGLAGGNWYLIREIIQKELKDCNVTIVIYEK